MMLLAQVPERKAQHEELASETRRLDNERTRIHAERASLAQRMQSERAREDQHLQQEKERLHHELDTEIQQYKHERAQEKAEHVSASQKDFTAAAPTRRSHLER